MLFASLNNDLKKQICDKYYLKRRLDMDLKIKTETEEFHGIEFYYIIKPKQQLQMLFIKNSEKTAA